MLDVILLGTGGTMPLPDRALTSLLLRVGGGNILVDCGEGTQVQLRRCGASMHDIDHILITHFHADHVTGLCGLLLSMSKCERKAPVTIVTPKGGAYIIRCLCVTIPKMPFEIRVTELDGEREEFCAGMLTVTAQSAHHSVPCYAYSFDLKRAGRFDPEAAERLGVEKKLWKTLQRGEIVRLPERTVTPDMVMGAPRKGLKVTYITDTRPSKKLEELARGSDLLVCEGMYADEEKLPMAKEKKHMIFSEASAIASSSGSKRLWLTHFSPSLSDPYEHEAYAKSLFENTLIPCDLERTELKFSS